MKTFTIRSFYERYPEIHTEIRDLIRPFCINLFFPNQKDILKSDFGSGVCVSLGGKTGILTNHHVAELFLKRQHGYVYVPHTETGRNTALRWKRVICLPENPDETNRGVDIAFIELVDGDDPKTLGKEVWDLDLSAKRYLENPHRYWAEENISFWSWVFYATPEEGARLKEGIGSTEEVFYPKASFQWAGPSHPILFPCSYSNLSKDVDKFYLPISRKGIDGSYLPKSYGGTSGTGLWQIEINDTPEGLKIVEIQLAGLVVQQTPLPPLPTEDLICRGHISLYETFYPFCKEIFASDDVQAALKKAYFLA